MEVTREIVWREPRGAETRRMLDELRTAGWNRANYWLRLLAIAYVASGALIALTAWWMPNAQIPVAKMLYAPLMAMAVGPVSLLGIALIALPIYQTIRVREDALVVSGGALALSGLIDISIDPRPSGAPLLVVRKLLRNGRTFQRVVEIAPTVDLDELQGLLDRITDRWAGTEPAPRLPLSRRIGRRPDRE